MYNLPRQVDPRRGAFVALLVLTLGGPAAAWEDDTLRLEGETRLRYDARVLTDDGGEDQDFSQGLDLLLTEKAWGHFRLAISGDLYEDTDGHRTGEQVGGIRDTFDSSVWGAVYRAWAELHGVGKLSRLRLGRQFLAGPLPAHLDGADLALRLLGPRLRARVYGGLPVRYFDRHTGWLDAQQAGVELTGWATEHTRLTAAYQYWREAGDDATADMHQAALSARQDILDLAQVSATFVWLDDRPRSLQLRAGVFLDEVGFAVDLSYFGQLVTLERIPTSASPFASLLGPVRPYHHVVVGLSQRLVETLYLDLSAEMRLLGPDQAAGAYNHEFHRETIGLAVDDLFVDGLRLAVHADVWQALAEDRDLLTVTGGGELRYRLVDVLRLALGGAYSLYKHDPLLDVAERTDVYTLFTDWRIWARDWLYVRARYEVEIYDLIAHRLSVTLGQRF